MQKKTGTYASSPEAETFFSKHSAGLSGADIEAILVRARMKSVLEQDTVVGADDIKAALDDFIPPSYPTEIELQVLAAVLECTSRSLLPEKFRQVDRSELMRRANELASLVRD
jgi:hypothetical protein